MVSYLSRNFKWFINDYIRFLTLKKYKVIYVNNEEQLCNELSLQFDIDEEKKIIVVDIENINNLKPITLDIIKSSREDIVIVSYEKSGNIIKEQDIYLILSEYIDMLGLKISPREIIARGYGVFDNIESQVSYGNIQKVLWLRNTYGGNNYEKVLELSHLAIMKLPSKIIQLSIDHVKLDIK